MKQITISRREMSITKINENIEKIIADYNIAKEKKDTKLMKELQSKFEFQKAVLKASKKFFDEHDLKDAKRKANTSGDVKEVRRAKWIINSKKEYEDSEELYNSIINTKELGSSSDILDASFIAKSKLKFRKFKKRLITGVLAAALLIGGLAGCNLTKKDKSKDTKTPYTTEASIDIEEENADAYNNEEKSSIISKDFSNDSVNVDESYKNIKYTDDGKSVSSYVSSISKGTGSTGISDGATTVTEKELDVTLPSKPSDTTKTVVLKENTEEESKTEENTNNGNENKTQNEEKTTYEEKEEKPDSSKNDPDQIEDDGKTNEEEKNEDKKTEDNTNKDEKVPTDTEEKPDPSKNNPDYIEEDEDGVTIIDKIDKEETKKDDSTFKKEESSTEKETEPSSSEEKPDPSKNNPDYIEEDEDGVTIVDEQNIENATSTDTKSVATLSEQIQSYTALKEVLLNEKMNQISENKGPVLTYTASRNC